MSALTLGGKKKTDRWTKGRQSVKSKTELTFLRNALKVVIGTSNAVIVRTDNAPFPRKDREDIERALTILGLSQKVDPSKRDQLVKLLVSAPELTTPTNLRLTAMAAKARSEVLNSGEWITAKEVARRCGLSETNPSTQPNKWKREGRIVAIDQHGVDLFPAFALDPNKNNRPYSQLRDVISALRPALTDWEIALWLTAANSYLDDKRPADMIAKQPSAVLHAAKCEVDDAQHG